MFDAARNPAGRLDPCLYAPSPVLSRIRPALAAALVLGLAAQGVLAGSIVRRSSELHVSSHAFLGHPDFSPGVTWPELDNPDYDLETGNYTNLGPLEIEVDAIHEPSGRVLEGTAGQKFDPVFDGEAGRLLSLSAEGYAEVRVQRFDALPTIAGIRAISDFVVVFEIAQPAFYDLTATSSREFVVHIVRGVPDGDHASDFSVLQNVFPNQPEAILLEAGFYMIQARVDIGLHPDFTFVGTVDDADRWAVDLRWSHDLYLDDAFRFVNPSGGAFDEPANWQAANEPTLQQVPVKDDTRADTAIFDLPATYSVDVGSQHTERLRVVNGHVTFTNADYEIAATSPDEPGVMIDNARLTLADGQMRAAHTLIGQQAASRLDVVGLESVYLNQARLRVGGAGEGRLVVANGGSVDSSESLIAAGTAPGDATVSSGGAWNAGSLAVGSAGPGRLAVESGGHVEANDVVLGFDAGTRGELHVHGVQGDLRSSLDANDIRVGLLGAGMLTIEAGGRVRSGGMMVTGLDDDAGALVTGRHNETPSTLEVSGTLLVGATDQPGRLRIHEGAAVTAESMVLGHFDSGLVTVLGAENGPPSTLATTDLFVGGSDQGTLAILGGGLTTTGSIAHIGGGQADPDEIGSRVDLAFMSADGRLSEWHIGSLLRVNHDGTLKLDPGGAVTIGAIEAADRKVRIGPGGVLSGDGVILAADGVEAAGGVDNFAGTVSPGASPGTLTIEGNYEQGAQGALEMEFAGREEGQFDQLVVTGNATLGGTLVLRFIDGFAPTAGDEFDFLAVGGTVEGELQEVHIEGLQLGFQHELVVAEGTYTLVALNDGRPLDADELPVPGCGPGCGPMGLAPLLLTALGLFGLRYVMPRRVSKY